MTNQFIMFGAQAMLIAVLILILFKLRKYLGLSPLYVTLGVFQPIQVLLASSIYIEIFPGLMISPGSVIMFTASLYAILLVYIREDAIEARKVIYGILVANLTMTLLLYIFGIQLGFASTLNFLNLPLGIFNQGARVMLTGTFALFADVILIIFVFEWIGRIIKIPLLRIYISMSIILIIDTLIFATGAFLGQPNYTSIIFAGIIGKVCMAAFYAFALTIYLRFWEPEEQGKIETTKPLRDIFYALTYREKYELEKQKLIATQDLSEKSLKEKEQFITAITETSPAIIYVSDMEQNRNVYVNTGMQRLLGYSSKDVTKMGDNLFQLLIHPDDLQNVIDFQAVVQSATDEDILGIEYRMKHQNGGWINLYSDERVFLRNSDGTVKQKIGVALNITERKQAEEEKEKRAAELIIANKELIFQNEEKEKRAAELINANKAILREITERKNAELELKKYQEHLEELVKSRTQDLESSNKELEAFAYSVSHDLRAPLRAIDGFTRILLEDYVEKMDAEANRLGSIIQKNSQKMGKLIDDLLAFSRLGRATMHFSEINMKSLVNDVYLDIASPEERKKINFELADLPKAYGDPNMLRQVWTNLLSNAIKFSAKQKKPVISVTCQIENNTSNYCIRDNGAGYNMQYQDKLFGVFQRLHSEKEFAGNGVGLALVRRIIQRHDGRIWAEGEIDKGAAFYFSLPKES